MALPARLEKLVETPRTLDKDWARVLRGDRGCAFDAISLVGALTSIISAVLATGEFLPWAVVYVGLGIWVLGFVLGTRFQLRSGRQRREALTHGTLVAAAILEAEPGLLMRDSGRRACKALVVYSDDPAAACDVTAAHVVAARVRESLNTEVSASTYPKLAALQGDPFAFHVVSLSPALAGASGYLATRMIVYPDRLEPEIFGPEMTLWAISDRTRNMLEQVPLFAAESDSR